MVRNNNNSNSKVMTAADSLAHKVCIKRHRLLKEVQHICRQQHVYCASHKLHPTFHSPTVSPYVGLGVQSHM